MKLLLSLFLFLFTYNIAITQDCPESSVYLRYQEEIDEFIALYPNCTEIKGDLRLGRSDFSSIISTISDLSPLSSITRIEGDLIIYHNPVLASLDGLQNITYVGRDLEIDNNDILSDISAINQIETIVEDLDIYNNPVLFSIGIFSEIDSIGAELTLNAIPITSLDAFPDLVFAGRISINRTDIVEIDGLNKLTSVENDVRITSNELAESITGFGMLEKIGGDFRISSNDTLELISGFTALDSVDGKLEILWNDNLETINSFESLKRIGEDLILERNVQLTSLASSFSSLDSILGNLIVEQNHSLTALPNFDQLKKCGNVEILENEMLASISGLFALTNLSGEIKIQSNASLTSLDGLDNIDPEQITRLWLNNNPNLSTCNIQSICDVILRNITRSISNNASGCATYDDLYYNSCRIHECKSNNLPFISQSQVDNFAIDNPYCTYMLGDLIIGDTTDIVGSTVINLDGLNMLDTIIGNIYIQNNALLESTLGIASTEFFEGAISVENNDNLVKLDLIKEMRMCNGDIEIMNNASLVEAKGLHGINTVTGDINIQSNPKLKEEVNFLSLDVIEGSLKIQNHPSLNEPMVFSSLVTIVGDFIYSNNNSGVSKGFPPLTIYGDLSIIDNNNWYNSTLCGIDTIWGNFKYINNEGRQSIKPSWLNYVGGDVVIEDNSNLLSLDFDSAPLTTIKGDLIIRNNGLRYNGLEGLISLRNVGGDLEISNIEELETLEGLQALSAEGISSITIKDNPNLNHCSIQSICTAFAADTIDVLISGNDSLCLDNPTVSADCSLSKCWRRSIVFKRQEEIDQFAIENPYCTVIDGFLSIEYDYPKDIYALKNIEVIKGYLNVAHISSQGDLNGLISFEGLENLRVIEGDLDIHKNQFPDFKGLDNLERIEGEIFIGGTNIESFNGLNNLKSVGAIRIPFDTESLVSLNGLESLDTIKNGFSTWPNHGLTSLDGIQNVRSFSGRLAIGGNHLSDITALSNWSAETTESINLYDSPLLEFCSVKYICEFYKLKPDKLSIDAQDNGIGCKSIEDLDCTAYGFTGTVYFDSNENGVRDINENGISGIGINVSPSSAMHITNEEGKYFQFADSGEVYTVTLASNPDWELSSSVDTYEITFDPESTDQYDFGVKPNFERHSSQLSLTLDNNRCNEEGTYHIKIQNTGTHIESGEIILSLDPLIEFVDSDLAPTSYEANNTLIWSYDELHPYQILKINVHVNNPNQNSTGVLLSSTLEQYATVAEESTLIESIVSESRVRCSYDPNDKQVSPAGEGEEAYILKDKPLTYTIRFQNTGNDYAKDIRLTDTIAPQFDIESLEILNSSHEVFVSIDGRVVTFLYDNIFLIDSTTDESSSHGFVSFRINLLEGIEDFTIIENFADIYFDFNPPIRTNTVTNTAVEMFPTSTNEVDKSINLVVIPNPTRDHMSISSSDAGTIDIYNAQMNKIINTHFIDGVTPQNFNISAWPSGLYFIRFTNDKHQTSVKSLLKI